MDALASAVLPGNHHFRSFSLVCTNSYCTSPHDDCTHLPVIFQSVFMVCPPMVTVPCPEPCTLSSLRASIFIVPEPFASSIVHSTLTSASLALELISFSVQFCLSAKGVFSS